MIGGMKPLGWPTYRAEFSDGTTREFVARHWYEAWDRACKYAGSGRTVNKVVEV